MSLGGLASIIVMTCTCAARGTSINGMALAMVCWRTIGRVVASPPVWSSFVVPRGDVCHAGHTILRLPLSRVSARLLSTKYWQREG